MSSIHISGHIREIKRLQRIRNTITVCLLGLSALGDVQVGDHVSKGIRLDDQRDTHVGILLKLLPDAVDVANVLLSTAIVEIELAVGCCGGAVTVGEVVDDNCADIWWVLPSVVGFLDTCEVWANIWDFGDDITTRQLAS